MRHPTVANARNAQLVRALRPQPADWAALTLAGGFTVNAACYTPAVRLRGDTVELCGGISGTLTAGSAVTIATLPAGFAPASSVHVVGVSNTGIAIIYAVAAASLTMTAQTQTTVTTVNLDGCQFRLV